MPQRAVLLTLCLAALGWSCGDSGEGGEQAGTCAAATAQLRDCGLVSEGAMPCLEPRSTADMCRRECLLRAECSDLRAALCQEALDAREFAIAMQMGLTACLLLCPPPEGCRPTTQPCNGVEECDDGSDEASCPPFACGRDEEVATALRCDGQEDCENGRDELGCAELLCDEEPPPDTTVGDAAAPSGI